MSEQNNNQTNQNSNNDNDTTTEQTSLFTKDMESSLWYDNNNMYTSSEAVDQFNGIISHEKIKDLTEFVVDGAQPLPDNTIVTQVLPFVKDRGHNDMKKTNTLPFYPAKAEEDALHWNRTEWVEGGYKFTTDENKLTTMIDKRLENDLGQQSEEGNRVFRSNVYVSMDVDAALALEGKSRGCKTGEVILESEYAYSTPKIQYAADDNLTFVIIDHNDYDKSAVRFYLNNQPDECIITISETNERDVVAAIGRYVRALNKLVDFNVRKYSRYFIVLSNASNPLRCNRCVLNINGNIIGDDFGKFRFGSSKQLAAATGKALNVIQNYNQYVYNYLEVADNNTSTYTGIKTLAATVNTSYTDYNGWNSITGTAVTWPAVDGTMPLSRQKWNIQDYYTALHYLVEYHYKISTPYDATTGANKYSDWSLLLPRSDYYGASKLPVCDYAVRVAFDKNMCKPINDHTHYIEHRGILANKLKVLANYRAGRLCACISETFGSFYNLKLIKDMELITMFHEILDAQTVGIYETDHLIGMVAHVKYSPDDPDYIANGTRSTINNLWYGTADPNDGTLLVEEYWPIPSYWRSDTFGLPTVDELDYEVNIIPAASQVGWKTPDKKKYYVYQGTIAKITYQFDKTVAPIHADVIFQAKLSGHWKSNDYGMYTCPGLFSCDCILSIEDRPNISNTQNAGSAWYAICTGNRMYNTLLNKNFGTTNRSKLFG
jgi:hypothetical protein